MRVGSVGWTESAILLGGRTGSGGSPGGGGGPATEQTLWLKADGVLWQDDARTIRANDIGHHVAVWESAASPLFFSQTADPARPVIASWTAPVVLAEDEPGFAPAPLFPAGAYPVVRFDGVAQFMQCAVTLGELITAGAFTLYAVVSYIGIATASGNTANHPPVVANTTGSWGMHAVSTLDTRMLANDAAEKFSTRVTGLNTIYGLRGRHFSNTLALIRSGLGEGPVASVGNTVGLGGTLLLGQSGISGSLLHFDLAELILYNYDLTVGEQNTVQTYLANKWGFTW